MLNQQKIKIYLALINAGLAILTLGLSYNYLLIKPVASVSIIIFLILCWFELSNILFLARTFILGLIGYFPMVIKIFLGENALFSGFEQSTQGFKIVVLMYIATSFALLSNTIGIYLGSIKTKTLNDVHLKHSTSNLSKSYWQIGFYIAIPIVIITAYKLSRSFGETIFTAGYGTSELTETLSLGSTNAIGITALYLMYIAGIKKIIPNWKMIFLPLAFYFIVFSQLMHGARQDAMTPLFGILVLYGVSSNRNIKLRTRWLPFFFLGYVLMEAWGLLRSTWDSTHLTFSFFIDVLPSMFSGEVVKLGTISPISSTFSSMVWLIDSGTLGMAWGRSYFEFLLRTPPEFMFPTRPTDYSWIYQDYGLITGGGFFELAEVYMNFGLFGALILPGLISFLLAKSYFFAMKSQSMLSYFLLFSFLSVFLRGTWYQTFAFYRAFLVCILFYLIIVFCKEFIFSKNKKHIHETL
jgi:hypothetical protein